MSKLTDFLSLLKKDPATDGADTFNIETMLNENWDKLDLFAGSMLTHAARHCPDGADPLTPSAIGAATIVTFHATVSAEWTESGNCFYQDIDVPGILATDNPIPGIAFGDDADANMLYADCSGKIFRISTEADRIRVWATKEAKTAFPIILEVVR